MEPSKRIETAPHKPKYRWTENFKGNCPANDLQNTVERILATHQLLGAFRDGARFYVRIELADCLPLAIAKLDQYITVAHPFLCDGDPSNDPAIDLEVGKDGAWYPVSVELADGNCRQCADGPLRIDFEERRKQVAFAAKWAANLLTQGYEQGSVSQLSGGND